MLCKVTHCTGHMVYFEGVLVCSLFSGVPKKTPAEGSFVTVVFFCLFVCFFKIFLSITASQVERN